MSDVVEFVEFAGCRLAYKVAGEGVPVVFVQGVGVHGDGWLPQVRGMKGVRSLRFDNRGMGESQAVANAALPFGAKITVEQMAADTLAVMDAAGFGEAHLVGHSLGGLVAMHVALTARTRVKSLTLMCTFANGATALKLTPRMFWLGTLSRVGTRASRRAAFLRIVMSPGRLARMNSSQRQEEAEKLRPLFGHDLANHPAVVGPQLDALKRYDATARLGELAVPVLVMSGAHDPISRPRDAGRVLPNGIPEAKYLEYADASHGDAD
jgi:pimeloyl-ACP methyl ester carboxylesterase